MDFVSGSTPLDGLLALQQEFPRYVIWRELRPGRARYVARSSRLGLNPYTVVTDDLAELRAALTGHDATGGDSA